MLWQTFSHLWVKSLVPRGGHNIIEPAQHGVAVVTGESHRKFPARLYGSSKAVTPCALSGPAAVPLTRCCIFWKNHQEKMHFWGVAPKRLFRVRMGATAYTHIGSDRDVVASNLSHPAACVCACGA